MVNDKRMKQVQAINLMRRFIDDQCTAEEVTKLIALMAFEKHREEYGRLIDEAIAGEKVEPVAIPDEVVRQRFRHLEERLGLRDRRRWREKALWRYYLAAAAIAGIILAVAWGAYHFSAFSARHYATGFGEIRKIDLPDGSVVTLNGNSTIDYLPMAGAERARTVELRGEAFFRVRKTSDHRKFRVVMPGAGAIEVLGTEFTVRHRPNGSRVVLRSGSIRLTTAGESLSGVVMKPGELIDITPGASVAGRKKLIRRHMTNGLPVNWFLKTPLFAR